MARLLRTHPQNSFITPPPVLGDSIRFRPISVTLAGRTRATYGRRAPHSKLNPPAVLAVAAAPFSARPPLITRAKDPDPRRRSTQYFYPGPAAVGPATTFLGSAIYLAHPRPRPIPKSKIRPPVVLAAAPPPFVAPALRLSLAVRTIVDRIRRAPKSKLRPPAVVTPPPPPVAPFRPLQIKLTYSKRGRPRSFQITPSGRPGIDLCHLSIHTLPDGTLTISPLADSTLTLTPLGDDSLTIRTDECD